MENNNMPRCTQCGAIIQPNEKFCGKCGVTIGSAPASGDRMGNAVNSVANNSAHNATTRFCMECGNQLANNAKFCRNCGNVVVQDGSVKNRTSFNKPAVSGFAGGTARKAEVIPAPSGAGFETDAPSTGYAALGFFFPLVGLILYLIWKASFPQRASSIGKGAILGVVIWLGIYILAIVVQFFILFSL